MKAAALLALGLSVRGQAAANVSSALPHMVVIGTKMQRCSHSCCHQLQHLAQLHLHCTRRRRAHLQYRTPAPFLLAPLTRVIGSNQCNI